MLATSTGNGYGPKLMRSLVASAQAELSAEIAFAENRIDEALLLQAKAVTAAENAQRKEPPHLAGGPLLRLVSSEEELIEEVRITVWHEIAHFFGLDDDHLDDLGYA